jgi:glutathione S-transferase
MPQKSRLITIAISHYCEKARWALERLEVPFVEEPHAPLFHRLATGSQGGGQTVPVLVTPQGCFADSTAILHYLDQNAPADCKLYPPDPAQRQQVEDLETLFDEQLGPAARQWVYAYLVENPALIRRLWQVRSPSGGWRLPLPPQPALWRRFSRFSRPWEIYCGMDTPIW